MTIGMRTPDRSGFQQLLLKRGGGTTERRRTVRELRHDRRMVHKLQYHINQSRLCGTRELDDYHPRNRFHEYKYVQIDSLKRGTGIFPGRYGGF